VVRGRWTSDREAASSTPGRSIAGYSLGQLSLPSLQGMYASTAAERNRRAGVFVVSLKVRRYWLQDKTKC